MEIAILNDILVMLGLSIGVLYLCHKVHVPSIVGFLLTGLMAGPHGLALVKGIHEVELIAEIGIVLLLFTIGIEFSFNKLLKIKKSVLLGGTVQVCGTILLGSLLADLFGLKVGQAIFMGFMISLSSTAIVLKVLQDRAEIESPHGQTVLGVLIFQDIVVVPMILLTPLLAGSTGGSMESVPVLLLKMLGIIGFVIVSAKWLVPYLLYQIAKTRSQELFLLTVVVLCLAVAALTSQAGLSLALGAFLAGLIISESEYSHQALGNVLPFRDIFTSFFFISIGMLLDISFVLQQPLSVLLIAAAVLLLKFLVATHAALIVGLPMRSSVMTGLALSQVGEFSFVLSKSGLEYGLLSEQNYQLFLAVAVLSMATTPFIIAFSGRIAQLVLKLPMPPKLKTGQYPVAHGANEVKTNHLVIIGYGLNGRNVTRAAKLAGIDYNILEMNPDTVRRERANGEPIFYGDATHTAVLNIVGIKDAKVVVVAIHDAAATRRITEALRRVNPRVQIIVRTRFIKEMDPLYALGADEVIPEELETSIEIFARVLANYLIPSDEIDRLVSEIRADNYEMFHGLARESKAIGNLTFADVDVVSLRVHKGSELVGQSMADLDLRKRFGITVLAVRRDEQTIPNPDRDLQLLPGDIMVVLGSDEKIAAIRPMLQAWVEPETE